MNEAVEKLRKLVDEIPGDNGWWHADDGDVYYDAATELLAVTGWDAEQVVDFLGSLYGAAANEFGS